MECNFRLYGTVSVQYPTEIVAAPGWLGLGGAHLPNNPLASSYLQCLVKRLGFRTSRSVWSARSLLPLSTAMAFKASPSSWLRGIGQRQQVARTPRKLSALARQPSALRASNPLRYYPLPRAQKS